MMPGAAAGRGPAREREQALLASLTTLGLGGPARRLVRARTEDEVMAGVRAADEQGEPLLVLGGGSNLVIADEGFPGTVVQMATRGIRVDPAPDGDQVAVTVAAGEDWDTVVGWSVAEGVAGLECLSGIPGSAGATPIQNVGAYGQEVAAAVTTVRAYDRERGTVTRLSRADCGFGYRDSAFKRRDLAAAGGCAGASPAGASPAAGAGARPGGGLPFEHATGRFVVLDVTVRLTRSPLSLPVRYHELAAALGVGEGGVAPLADVRAAVLSLRRGKGMVLDPADPDTRSAGSFFTNPVLAPAEFARLERLAAGVVGDGARVPRFPAAGGGVKVPAAWLIERAGFGKGYPGTGGTGPRISSKHTLALVNPGGASTGSLLRLAAQIRDGVRDVFGVDLVCEPALIGTGL